MEDYPEADDRDRDHTHSGFHSNFFAPPVKMSDLAKEKEHHRLSFGGLHLGGSRSKDQTQHPNASLDWKLESPPTVLYGDTENSTGALVSGQVLLTVKETCFEVESISARLEIHMIQKRPVQGHCQDCAHQRTELKSQNFVQAPQALAKGVHSYPFSTLLEGHLPASTDNSVVAIRYEFTAEVKPKTGPNMKLLRTIDVKRALQVPELPHNSIRIFPPTNIKASVHYPQVIHPIGKNTLQIKIDGIVKSNPDVKTVEYWKLKRLSWKIEEHLNTVAPACPKHASKDSESGEPTKKGIKRTETRTIGSADLSSGWKSDYSPNGNIAMELDYQCNTGSKAVCDMKSKDGTEITHQLVVELVVVQEYAPIHQPKHVTPTGVARILRMHFATVLTERAGLGVSWDNEAPPIYQDVPPSPPSYLCEIPYEEVEGLSLLSGSARTSSEASHRTGSARASSSSLS